MNVDFSRFGERGLVCALSKERDVVMGGLIEREIDGSVLMEMRRKPKRFRLLVLGTCLDGSDESDASFKACS